MSLFELFGVLVILGVCVWAIKKLVPMDPPFLNGLYVLSVLIVVFLLDGVVGQKTWAVLEEPNGTS
jgi:hypothetical protein